MLIAQGAIGTLLKVLPRYDLVLKVRITESVAQCQGMLGSRTNNANLDIPDQEFLVDLGHLDLEPQILLLLRHANAQLALQ